MDIARIGVVVDPTKAKSGSAEAASAIASIGTAAEQMAAKVDKATDKAAKNTDKTAKAAKGAARATRSGFLDMTSGVVNFMDALGLLNTGWGQFIRRTDSALQAGRQLKGVLNAAQARRGGSGAGAAAELAATATAAESAAASMGTAGAAAGAMAAGMGAAVPIIMAVVAAAAALATGLGALYGVYKLFMTGLPFATQFENDSVAIEGMLGSTTKAKKLLDELVALAAKTPLESPDLNASARIILAMDQPLETTVDTLRMLGDVATGAQIPLKDLSVIWGKAVTGNRLMGDDLRQLNERGIPVMKIFANLLNTDTAGVRKLSEAGELTFPYLEKAFKRLTGEGGRFYKAMERGSETWTGRMSTLRDNWGILLRSFSTPIMDKIKPMLKDLSAYLERMIPTAQAAGQAIGDALGAIYQVVATDQIGQMISLGIAAGLETGAAMGVTAFTYMIGTIYSNMITTIGAAIAWLVNLFGSLIAASIDITTAMMTGDWGKVFETLWSFFQSLATGVIGKIAEMIYNALGNAFKNVAASFGNAVSKIVNAAANFSNGIGKPKVPGMITGTAQGSAGYVKGGASIDNSLKPNSILDPANSVTGTAARDAFAKFMAEQTAAFNAANPPRKPIESGVTDYPEGPSLGKKDKGGKGGTEKATKAIKEQTDALQKLTKEWGNFDAQMADVIAGSLESFMRGFSDAITDVIMGTKSLKEAFKEMAASVISDIIRMIVQMQIKLAIAMALEALGYGQAGAAVASAHTGGSAGGNLTSRAHTGATGTYQNLTRVPTYHRGGASSERDIRVERNETILTRRRAAQIESELSSRRGDAKKQGAGERPVTIVNITDRQEILDAISAHPDAVINAISRRRPALRQLVLTSK